MSKPLLVYLDSNILFSAAYLPSAGIARLWTIPEVDILVSRYTLDEVTRHLKEPDQRARLWKLLYQSHLVPDATTRNLPAGIVLVDKDAPVLLTAMDARADVLVTGDRRHFRNLFDTTVGGVRIESVERFAAGYPEIFKAEERISL